MPDESLRIGAHRWSHRLAVVTAVVLFLMLLSGAQVTSYRVGMADPLWPTFTLAFWLADSVGLMIEHRHRIVGLIVGNLAIALTVLVWIFDRRSWLRWLTVGVLTLICVQGVLGGMRVVLNARGIGPEIAVVHAVVGQLCFAAICLVVYWTGSRESGPVMESELAAPVQKLSAVGVAGLVVAIVAGACQRQLGTGFAVHAPLTIAWVIVAVYLTFVIGLHADLNARLGGLGRLVAGLTVVQVLLGLGSLWATGLVHPGLQSAPTDFQALLRTWHLGVGALVFGSAVCLAVAARERLRQAVPGSAAYVPDRIAEAHA